MSQPETRVRNAVMSYLKFKHIPCWIFDSVGIWDERKRCYRIREGVHRTRGLPDVMGILPGGRFIAIEVKSETGRLSEHQRRWIDAINEQGGVAFVARSIKDVELKLAEVLGG